MCRHEATNGNGDGWIHQHEEGLQLHDVNAYDMTDDNITSLLQVLFYNDNEAAGAAGVGKRRIETRGELEWSHMHTRKSK